MIKVTLCPRHKTPLHVSNESIVFAGNIYSVCTGVCPMCSVTYIDQQFMSCSSITVGGKKYEFLPELEAHANQQRENDLIQSNERKQQSVGVKNMEQMLSQDGIDCNKKAPCQQMRQNAQQHDMQRALAGAEKRHIAQPVGSQKRNRESLLAAEKTEEMQRKLDLLEEQKAELKEQLLQAWSMLRENEDQYRTQLIALRERLQTQAKQDACSLETKYKKKVQATVIEYQARIDRLNALHKTALDHILTELEKERRRAASLQQNNAVLVNQIEALTKKLETVRKPANQVIFINEKLYVCGGTIRCEKHNHVREEVTAVLDTMQGKLVSMTVYHCQSCNLYYIHDAVFNSYRDRYGGLLGNFICKPDGMKLGQAMDCSELAPESVLHMNGYNVNQTADLLPRERRKILAYMIESHIMTKQEIRNHLSYLIKINQSNPSKNVAISRWNSDVRWVNDYHRGSQETVWLSDTALYRYYRKQ